MKKILSVSLCALLLLGALPLLVAPARALTADIVATPDATTAAVGDNFSWVVNPTPPDAVYHYLNGVYKDGVQIHQSSWFNGLNRWLKYQFLQPGVYKPKFTVRDMNSNEEITIFGREVTVRYLPAPVLTITAPSGTLGTSLAVAWTPVTGAASYQLLRADAPDGVYSLLASTTATAFQDTGLLPGVTYYYKVAAFITVGIIDCQSSEWSAPRAGTTPLAAAPAVTSAAPSGTLGTSLAVAWTPVTGAASYQLLRANATDGVYSLLATTTAAAFRDTGLLPGATYYYKAAAFITIGGGSYQYSQWSAPRAGTTLRPAGTPDAPGTAASSPLGTSLKLTWAPLSGADAYRVIRADGSDGAYRVIRVTRLAYLYDAGLTPGRRYAYRIVPLAIVGGAYYPSGAASAPRVAAPMGAAALTSAAAAGRDRARLSWTAAPGAAAYRVWVSKSPASGYALARTTAATALTVTGLDPNTPYYFKVQPYSQAYPLVFDGPMSGYRAVRTLK